MSDLRSSAIFLRKSFHSKLCTGCNRSTMIAMMVTIEETVNEEL
jgi:hypothetical protein